MEGQVGQSDVLASTGLLEVVVMWEVYMIYEGACQVACVRGRRYIAPEGNHFVDVILLLYGFLNHVEHPPEARVLAALGVVDGEEYERLSLGAHDTAIVVFNVGPNGVLIEGFC